jgi:hypothetical protein
MLAAQVGGSCLVLIVSAMMVRSLQNALSADLGFNYEDSAVLQAGLAQAGLKDDAARAFWLSLKDRAAASPDVEVSALALMPPFQGRIVAEPTRRGERGVGGYPEAPRLRVTANHVDPAYFAVLDIPIVAGRAFAPGDDPDHTVIISRTLAQAMYGSLDIVGGSFPRSEPRDTIVGIAGDTSSVRPGQRGFADLYRPLAAADYERVVLLARGRASATALAIALRGVAQEDSRVFAAVRLLRDDFDNQLSSSRIASGIGASIGMLTLMLACIGIFGVVSYGVTLRTREIGIHLALGAGRGSILRVVTRHVLSPVSLGMIIGTVAAVPIAIALAASPLQLAFEDPISYASALAILAAAGAAAALIPAMRALRADPIRALRHE